jgi:MFS family permease
MWKVKSQSVTSLFITANSISWFLLTLIIFINILSGEANQLTFVQILMLSAAYFGGLILSSIIGGTLLSKKLLKRSGLLLWALTGVMSCLLLSLFYSSASLVTMLALFFFLSCSIGLGIPTCLSLFATQTKADNRGRWGAIIFFTVQMLSVLILMVLSNASFEFQFLILAIWRLAGLTGITLYNQAEKKSEERKTSIQSIFAERRFILLFIPWFMFTVINYIETPVLQIHMSNIGTDFYDLYNLVTILIASVAAIPAGIICDRKGRKITSIAGFIFLGLGYAFLSILSGTELVAYILFMIFDGIAWGILYTLFIFVIWGDLSDGANREKYYLLGGLPFLFAGLIQVIVQPFAASINIGLSFSLASIFLFIAVLPLVFAPESMAEKIIRERELNNYVQKALNTVKKNRNKETQNEQKENSNEKKSENRDQNVEESSHDKKARELAEKYY